MSFAEINGNKLKNCSTESFESSEVQVEVQIAKYKHLLSNFSISVCFPQTFAIRRMDQSILSFLIELRALTGLNRIENTLKKFSFRLF